MMEDPKTCPKCGSPVAPGLKFCEACGTKVGSLPVCTKCGAPLAPGVKFCADCGTPIAPDADPVKTAKEDALPVAAPDPPVPEPGAIQKTPSHARPPVKETPMEVPTSTSEAAATVSPLSEKKSMQQTPDAAVPPVEETPVEVSRVAAAVATWTGPESGDGETVVPKENSPKKPLSSLTMLVTGVIFLAVLGVVVYFVGLPLLSGSAMSAQNPTLSPVGTNFGSTAGSSSATPGTTAYTTQTGSVSLTAGPTQVPPTNLGLIIDVERDAITHMITVTFQGGPGQYGVRELVVTLTKSDGTAETKTFKPEYRGTFITLLGTEKTDRVEITANYYNGESFKVVDKVFEYKKRTGSP